MGRLTSGAGQVAAGGFSAAVDAAARATPAHAHARRAIGSIKERVGGGVAVEVGVGTGLLTGQLTRAGVDVIAIEPAAEMRTHLRRALPQLTVLGAAAERLPLRTASADAVLLGGSLQTSDAELALEEFARVLAPGGLLAMIRNDPTALHELEQLAGEHPDFGPAARESHPRSTSLRPGESLDADRDVTELLVWPRR